MRRTLPPDHGRGCDLRDLRRERYYWFPKMFGRMMNEAGVGCHFWFTFIGTYAIFMPMHYLGMAGQPRRYSQMTELAYLHDLIPLQKFMTYAAFFTIAVPAHFPVQSLLEHVQGAEGQRQSVGSDNSRVDNCDSASARQL